MKTSRLLGILVIVFVLCARGAFAFGPSGGGGSGGGTPGGTNGQTQYNNSGVLGGFTLGGALGSHNFATSLSSSGVLAGAQPAFSDISGSATSAQLPNPSASTLGGIQSAVSVSHQWINSISTSGVPALSQPASTDISGLGSAATVNTGTSGATLGLLNGNLTFSGSDTVNTATSGDSSGSIASTQFVTYALAALNPLASVNEATAAILPNTPTYSNGSSGVGATLTRTGNGTLTVDGTVVALNDRVLVKNQTSAFQNGVYLATAAGDGSNPWVLTRATDYNTAANINSTGDVPVTAGSTLAGTLWLQTATITTIGTDSLTYIQINAPQGGGGGNGNQLNGDVTGKSNNTTVSKIQGVVISGSAANTKVLTATSATAATWSTPASGGGIFTHTVSGTNQVLTNNSSSAAAIDVQNHITSANTIDTLPADSATADGETQIIKFVQPSGSHNWTASIAADVGVTTTLVNAVPGGTCPTLGTSTGNELFYDVVYRKAATEWVIVACPTNPAQAVSTVSLTSGVTGVLPVANGGTNSTNGPAYLISAGNETYGSNSLYVTGQQISAGKAGTACHFTSLTCINTFHAATCTTAPTVNVFDGASTTGTTQICSNALQGTRGTVTNVAQTLAINSGDIYGIYISTQGGTCLTDQFTVTADITCP